MKLNLLTCGIATMLAGCTTANYQSTDRLVLPAIESSIAVAEPVVDTAKNPSTENSDHCGDHQRDLTVIWALRQYWCNITGQPTYRDSLSSTSKVLVASNTPHIDIEASPTQNSHWGPDNEALEPLVSAKEIPTSKPAKLLSSKTVETQPADLHAKPKIVVSNKSSELSFEKLARAASRLPASIIFAKNLRILGPEGRVATESLIDQVNAADIVKLRGLLLPEEATEDSYTYREIMSVGRALAVRAHWRKQGVDISHIKILHHDARLHGRAVLVYFDA